MKKFLIGFGIVTVVSWIVSKIIEKKSCTELDICCDCPVYIENDEDNTNYMYQD